MSYYAEFDDNPKTGGDVATTLGWKEFADWVGDLDSECAELRHLVEHGWSQELDDLASDLQDAIDEGGHEDSIDIAENLLGMIEAVDGAEVLVVTDGVGVE